MASLTPRDMRGPEVTSLPVYPLTRVRILPTDSAPVGVTYFVSAAGSDSADGLTTSTPFQTIAKVNALPLGPGDTVSFRGGDTFTGQVLPISGGSSANPITFTSYGTGRATITHATLSTFRLVNVGGFAIRDLILVGGGAPFTNEPAGVDAYATTGNSRRDFLLVDNCDISGFQHGVIIGGDTNAEGFTNVTVNNCDCHGNQDNGVTTWGGTPSGTVYSHYNVTVTACRSYSNPGNPASDVTNPTGNGIVLGSVSTALVDGCTAHDNGGNNGTSGPVGIWCYDSDAVTIQNCVSYSNTTSSTSDGGGFDLDVGVTNSTIQYCLAYNNYGAGVLLFGAGAGNVVRYNMLWGNARNTTSGTTYSEIKLGNDTNGSAIYGNTCYAKDVGGTGISALSIDATPVGVTIRNNVFVSATGPIAVTSSAWATSAVLMQGNDYYRPAGTSIKWGASTYTTLAAWRAAVAGQEQVSAVNVGFTVDPVFTDAATTPAVTDAANVTAYTGLQLAFGSTIKTAGQDMQTTFGVNPGTRDFFGSALTVPLSIGAHENDVTGVSVDAGNATGAGAGADAVATVAPGAGQPAGAGAASDAAASVAVNAECPTATGTANDATVSVATATNAPAECATATGSATDASVTVAPNAEQPAATGIANDATVSTSVFTNAPAEVATATGAATDAVVTVAPSAEQPAATGTGNTAASTVAPNAEQPSASGQGLDAAPTVAVNAGQAAATGAGFDAGPSAEAQAGTGTATGVGLDAGTAVAVNAESPTAAGVANDATAQAGGNTNVAAGSATATGAADNATGIVGATAGTPTGLAVASDAAVFVAVAAELAAAAGVGLDATIGLPVYPVFGVDGTVSAAGMLDGDSSMCAAAR